VFESIKEGKNDTHNSKDNETSFPDFLLEQR
jgi:hypothetical protein